MVETIRHNTHDKLQPVANDRPRLDTHEAATRLRLSYALVTGWPAQSDTPKIVCKGKDRMPCITDTMRGVGMIITMKGTHGE